MCAAAAARLKLPQVARSVFCSVVSVVSDQGTLFRVMRKCDEKLCWRVHDVL